MGSFLRTLLGKFVRENLKLMDRRRLGKKIGRLFHQCRRDPAVEMRVAAAFVIERVENGKGGWPLLNGEQRNRGRLSIHERYGGTQKIRDLFLLARLRLQRNV